MRDPIDIAFSHLVTLNDEGFEPGTKLTHQIVVPAEQLHLRNAITGLRVAFVVSGDVPSGSNSMIFGQMLSSNWRLKAQSRSSLLFDIKGEVAGNSLMPMDCRFDSGTGLKLEFSLDPDPHAWPEAPPGLTVSVLYKCGIRLIEQPMGSK